MDTKKLNAMIKKVEKKRENQLKKVRAAEAKVAEEKKALKGIDKELKPMYDLLEKLAKFEADFNASVADLAEDEPEKAEQAVEKPLEASVAPSLIQ